MATYVILSRFSSEAFDDPKDFKKMADAVSSRIEKECKGVVWKQTFRHIGALRRGRHRGSGGSQAD